MTLQLFVNDVFESISGEAGGFPQGTWTTFIRLQGCNLCVPAWGGGCKWCDTPHARGRKVGVAPWTIPDLARKVNNKHVLITGGEPLAQRDACIALIQWLTMAGHIIQVETNGSLPLAIFNIFGVHWVVDDKPPSSGVSKAMFSTQAMATWARVVREHSGTVSIKWVVADKEDLTYALERMEDLILVHNCVLPFFLSPMDGDGTKIEDIVASVRLRNPALLDHITFSVQLHKLIKMP